MADRNNDDIAAALHGLSSGDDGDATPPQNPPPPARPAIKKRPDAPARPAMPDAPRMSPPPVPRTTPTPAITSRPGARPALPGQSSSTAQTTESIASESFPESAGSAYTPRARAKKLSARAGLRRTMIPILLTLGTMMLIVALGRWIFDPDAPLANLPLWAPAPARRRRDHVIWVCGAQHAHGTE